MRAAKIKSLIEKRDPLGLPKAITLIESTRADHRKDAEALLEALMPSTGNSIRIGISGIPGVGKSTFIEAFGVHLIKAGFRVAVLAVDPSSPITGGSILGDKTRMNQLAMSENAFIRPSPSGGSLGGVARHTRECILLCEAAGFDIVIVETVGVGQSEITVASMVDIFIPLHMPHTGDELQGIKKGVLEVADMVIITKADGPTRQSAELARSDIQRAFSLVRASEGEVPQVLLVSSTEGTGIADAWIEMKKFNDQRKKSGRYQTRRINQQVSWLDQEIDSYLRDFLRQRKGYETTYQNACNAATSLAVPASIAARRLVEELIQT